MDEFSIKDLQTVTDCDAVVEEAELELKEFTTQLANIDLKKNRADNTDAKNTVALAVNKAELQGLETAAGTVTNTTALTTLNNRIVKVRNRVENLEVDGAGKGVIKVLKTQLDVAQLNSLIQITTTFINLVKDKRAILAQA